MAEAGVCTTQTSRLVRMVGVCIKRNFCDALPYSAGMCRGCAVLCCADGRTPLVACSRLFCFCFCFSCARSTSAHLAARMVYTAEFEFGDIEGRNVLDLGCGTGMLGIAASILGAGTVTGLDVDDGALRAAAENADCMDVGMDLVCCDVARNPCVPGTCVSVTHTNCTPWSCRTEEALMPSPLLYGYLRVGDLLPRSRLDRYSGKSDTSTQNPLRTLTLQKTATTGRLTNVTNLTHRLTD